MRSVNAFLLETIPFSSIHPTNPSILLLSPPSFVALKLRVDGEKLQKDKKKKKSWRKKMRRSSVVTQGWRSAGYKMWHLLLAVFLFLFFFFLFFLSRNSKALFSVRKRKIKRNAINIKYWEQNFHIFFFKLILLIPDQVMR